jgi:glutamine cyclotransferase
VKNNIRLQLSTLLIICSYIACTDSESVANDSGNTATPPPLISYTVLASYPHDTGSFTQGLEIHKGILYESTGNPDNLPNNGSWIGKVNLSTGIADKKALFPKDVFGEGISILHEKIYRLTWQNQKAYIYNLSDYSPVRELMYQGEGWGLTNDGKNLIMSNGSNILSYRDPQTFKEIKQISVHDNSGMKNNLNELEFINGYIFANVWQTSQILKIDTANGEVKGVLDLTEFIRNDPKLSVPPTDVLNGIAWDSSTQKILITGKKWPAIFELKLN